MKPVRKLSKYEASLRAKSAKLRKALLRGDWFVGDPDEADKAWKEAGRAAKRPPR